MSLPNTAKEKLMEGVFDLVNNTIKVMLLTSSHTTNIDTQEFIDDVSANEVSGAGYSAGGATLGSKTVTADNTDDEGVFDAADTAWSTATITARYAVVYKDTGTPATSPILCIIDFGADKVSTGGTFQITWAAEGIVNIG